jgi:hypothetical protein
MDCGNVMLTVLNFSLTNCLKLKCYGQNEDRHVALFILKKEWIKSCLKSFCSFIGIKVMRFNIRISLIYIVSFKIPFNINKVINFNKLSFELFYVCLDSFHITLGEGQLISRRDKSKY